MFPTYGTLSSVVNRCLTKDFMMPLALLLIWIAMPQSLGQNICRKMKYAKETVRTTT